MTAKKSGTHKAGGPRPSAPRTAKAPRAQPRTQTMAQAAAEAFEKGFYSKGVLRPEHTDETQLKLVYPLLPTGVAIGQLHALALAVRAVGDLEPFAPEEAVTAKQKKALAALAAEKKMPAPFQELVAAAKPHVEKRRDLYALYGVVAGMMDKINTMANTMRLADATAAATGARG